MVTKRREPSVMGFHHPDEDEAGGIPARRNERAAREISDTDEDG